MLVEEFKQAKKSIKKLAKVKMKEEKCEFIPIQKGEILAFRTKTFKSSHVTPIDDVIDNFI